MGKRIPPSPKCRPLTPREIAEVRAIRADVALWLNAVKRLGAYVPASEAARRMGFRSVRTVLDLVRRGYFPGSWKPAPNRLHLRVDEIEAYIAARRVQP